MNFGSLQHVPGIGQNGNDSGNYPVLLVRRKPAPLVSPDLDAAWFGREQREQNELVDSSEHGSFQLVSRRRVRLAYGLFVLAFGPIAALLIWELRTHFAADAQRNGSVILESR